MSIKVLMYLLNCHIQKVAKFNKANLIKLNDGKKNTSGLKILEIFERTKKC